MQKGGDTDACMAQARNPVACGLLDGGTHRGKWDALERRGLGADPLGSRGWLRAFPDAPLPWGRRPRPTRIVRVLPGRSLRRHALQPWSSGGHRGGRDRVRRLGRDLVRRHRRGGSNHRDQKPRHVLKIVVCEVGECLSTSGP